ncbi:MAG: hypothetical protein Pars93KO_28120 [Parasphingorhabdus sp.]
MVLVPGGGFANETRYVVHQFKGAFDLSYVSMIGTADWMDNTHYQTVYEPPSIMVPHNALVIGKALSLIRATFSMISIIRDFKPDALLCVGHSVALPACIAARLSGVKTIYVESITRTISLSKTGLTLYRLRLCHKFYVQWQRLGKDYPRSSYKGTVLDIRHSGHNTV